MRFKYAIVNLLLGIRPSHKSCNLPANNFPISLARTPALIVGDRYATWILNLFAGGYICVCVCVWCDYERVSGMKFNWIKDTRTLIIITRFDALARICMHTANRKPVSILQLEDVSQDNYQPQQHRSTHLQANGVRCKHTTLTDYPSFNCTSCSQFSNTNESFQSQLNVRNQLISNYSTEAVSRGTAWLMVGHPNPPWK